MTDRPSPAVEAAMAEIHTALVGRGLAAAIHRTPIYHHWEDESLDFPPLYEQISIAVTPAGIRAFCRSDREGTAIEGLIVAFDDERGPQGARALIFDAAERRALRAHGWLGSAYWSGRWSADDPSRIAAAFVAIETLDPRVLEPADLPPGMPWPWPDLLYHVLLAELVGVEGAGAERVLLTRVDGTTHRVQVDEGSRWERLRRAWSAAPPRLRRLSERGRGVSG
ncbi:MAG: hypothetical protein H6711_34260 [Myxococcales bacterium]|nr:hypothetical protein [Myxococcales bacterium]